MSHSSQPSTHDADHWLAYRYLTGELTDDEADSFEARLADEVPLQQALADCVTLTTGLSRLASPPSTHTTAPVTVAANRSSRGPFVWASAAACIVLAGLLMLRLPDETDLVVGHDLEDTALDSQLDPAEMMAVWSVLGIDDEAELEQDADSGPTAAGDELDVPDWMLAAVLDEIGDDVDAAPRQEHQL